MLGIVFPGQGSQFRGMGEALFPKYTHLVEEANDVLGYSVETLCLKDPDKKLSSTQYTQPALYVVNALFYRELMAKGEKPNILAGHSLGEYNALNAAGVFDFSTGLKLVKKRGEIMSQAKGGGMAAVLGLTAQEIKNIMNKHGITDIDFANFNSPLQTVISGPTQTIAKLEKHFVGEGVRYVPLNVSAPFHSRYMMQASEEFATFVRKFNFSEASIPVISNVFARYFTGKSEMQDSLSTQISSAVRWAEGMQYFIRNGGSKILESGPGTVLSQLFEFIKKQSNKSDLEPVKLAPQARVSQGQYSSGADDKIVQTNGLQSQGRVAPETRSATRTPKPRENPAAPVGEIAAVIPVAASTAREFTSADLHDYLAKTLRQLSLGSKSFCEEYNLRFPYVVGGMQNGISSAKMLIRLGRAGILGFLGTHELAKEQVESNLLTLKEQLKNREPFGVNIVHHISSPDYDRELFELMLAQEVRVLELSNFFRLNDSLIQYRFSGARKLNGQDIIPNKIIVKVDRRETAEIFMSPAPLDILQELQRQDKLTAEEVDIASRNPICTDLCIVGNAGWRSDGDSALGIWPGVKSARNEISARHHYKKPIRIGLAGGFGSPDTISTAFVLGADFIVTGSINQCTVEAQTSDSVKDMLQDAGVKDFSYASSHDLFEMGDKSQVLKRGVFFPHRANKLYQYYCQFGCLSDIDDKIVDELESRYFRKSIAEVLTEVRQAETTKNLKDMGKDGKTELALLFKWYLKKSFMAAMTGDTEDKVNYQVFSSSAMGAFNEYVKGTPLANWKNRHVDTIAIQLMSDSAKLVGEQIQAMIDAVPISPINSAHSIFPPGVTKLPDFAES